MTARLLVTMLALTSVLLGVLVVPLGVESARSQRRDLRTKVERDATAVASLAEDALEADAPAPAAVTRLASRYLVETGGRIVVVDRRGISVVDPASPIGRDFSTRPEIASALAGEVATGTRPSETLGTSLLYVAVPVASGGAVQGAARITYPTSTADVRVRNTWLALAAISGFALAVAAGVAFDDPGQRVEPPDRGRDASQQQGEAVEAPEVRQFVQQHGAQPLVPPALHVER